MTWEGEEAKQERGVAMATLENYGSKWVNVFIQINLKINNLLLARFDEQHVIYIKNDDQQIPPSFLM